MLRLVFAVDELRLVLELLLPDELRDTLDEPLFPLTLRDELELLLTLRLELVLELVLLGRSYVEPDCAERLVVAGATLRTACELFDCDTLRLEVEPDTLRLELLPATLRLELEPATLRLELLPDTLRLDDEPATVRLEDEPDTVLSGLALLPFTDLEATVFDVRLTLRLLLDENAATVRSVLRLRFLSHPPLLILRLGV